MERYKYPRTYHVPWSEGATNDDKMLKDMSNFYGKEIVVTEKLDGENYSIYSDGQSHSRSTSGGNHISQSYVKQLTQSISVFLEKEERFCGENVYARHSIEYSELPTYYFIFSLWKDRICLSWDDTIERINTINSAFENYNMKPIYSVPVLYEGIYDEQLIKNLFTGGSVFSGEQEGYVIRVKNAFHMDEFEKNVAKFVRKDHVQSEKHWKTQTMSQNKLKV